MALPMATLFVVLRWLEATHRRLGEFVVAGASSASSPLWPSEPLFRSVPFRSSDACSGSSPSCLCSAQLLASGEDGAAGGDLRRYLVRGIRRARPVRLMVRIGARLIAPAHGHQRVLGTYGGRRGSAAPLTGIDVNREGSSTFTAALTS